MCAASVTDASGVTVIGSRVMMSAAVFWVMVPPRKPRKAPGCPIF
jgi:hypothetical protein